MAAATRGRMKGQKQPVPSRSSLWLRSVLSGTSRHAFPVLSLMDYGCDPGVQIVNYQLIRIGACGENELPSQVRTGLGPLREMPSCCTGIVGVDLI